MTSSLTANSRFSRAALVLGVAASVAIGVWAGSYFLVSSSLGPPLLGVANHALPGWSVERITWGPSLNWVAFIKPRLTNFEGKPTVTATAAVLSLRGLRPHELQLFEPKVVGSSGELGLGASRLTARVDGEMRAIGGMRLSALKAQDFRLDLRWDDHGNFNLSKSFRATQPPPETVRPDTTGPPPRLPWMQIDGIVLADAVISFAWSGGRFDAEDVTATGTYATTPWAGIFVDADLTGKRSRLELPDIMAPARDWERISIRDYRMEEFVTSVGELALTTDSMSFVRASSVLVGPGRVQGQLALAVPHLQTGPTSIQGVRGTSRIDFTRKTVGAVGEITFEDVAVDGLQGAHDLHVAHSAMSRLHVELDGTAATMRADGVRVGQFSAAWAPDPIQQANISASADVSIGGGSYRAALNTKGNGSLTTRGTIDVSLWRQRVSTEAQVSLQNLTGPLARLMDVTPPGQGTLTYRASAPFSELRRGTWRPAFKRVATPLENKGSPGEQLP